MSVAVINVIIIITIIIIFSVIIIQKFRNSFHEIHRYNFRHTSLPSSSSTEVTSTLFCPTKRPLGDLFVNPPLFLKVSA